MLDLHGGLTQLLHLALGLGHSLGDGPPHLIELLRRLVDVGKGQPQVLELGLELVRLLHHAGEGTAHHVQLPQGGDLLLHQLLLILLKTACHMEHRVEALFLPDLSRLPPFFTK